MTNPKILRVAEQLKKKAPDVETEPLFDIDASAGGQAVDESQSRSGRRSRAGDRKRKRCDYCGQLVLPGPHTYSVHTEGGLSILRICSKETPHA